VRVPALLLSCFVCLFVAATAVAQEAAQPRTNAPATTGNRLLDLLNQKSLKSECKGDYCILTGQVELPIDPQTTLFADQVELYRDTNRIVAAGNVVFATADGRLSADRVAYDVEAGTGTFETASGLMSLGDLADRRQFGNQDADVYFFGDTIEKLGPRRYRITRGGFSTCTQPTPRWEVTSGSLVLNLNDYAIGRNSVLRVKGVPVMYLPLVYYPISEDDRSTGFLLPTYGTSRVRGQTISNAFFWAINRSTDATLFHDWFSGAGQGAGAEYRYVAAGQSAGDVRFYRLGRRESTFTEDGQTQTWPAGNSYEVAANMNHALSRNIRARARVDYFTDLVTQQIYHQDLYQQSRNRRLVEAGLTANARSLTSTVLYQRSEVFNDTESSQIYGSTPRITTSLAPQRLFNAPVYASVNAEYAVLPSQTITDGMVASDTGFSRMDVTPTLRVPLSRLTFLSVNTSASYRTTRYSRSIEQDIEEDEDDSGTTVDEPYLRQFMTLRSDIVGPVFTRIWDLEGGFAERIKHVIEPAYTVDFTSTIVDDTRTPSVGSDLSDIAVSGTTKVTYGITNRLFARTRTVENVRGTTREIVTVGLQQTYYSNARAGRYDSSYQSTYGSQRPLDLSPLALTTRVSPVTFFDTNLRIEYDVARGNGLQTVSLGGTLNAAAMSVGANFSHSRTDPDRPSKFVSATSSMRWLEGRATGTYNVNWDIANSYIVSQSIVASYLAQCCGLQIEFQKRNYGSLGSSLALPSDTQFNFGFILAGLGTFSNFFGAFGGQR
jgi:LPS-assembly protein